MYFEHILSLSPTYHWFFQPSHSTNFMLFFSLLKNPNHTNQMKTNKQKNKLCKNYQIKQTIKKEEEERKESRTWLCNAQLLPGMGLTLECN